ncbi:MAG: dihydroorotase [Clostridiales bacterium]|jgi:dihydroorotase|nr:dihydroorotase [Clostridiales bacterium]
MKTVIKDAKVRGADGKETLKNINIVDGVIESISDEITLSGPKIYDAGGKYALPGFIDLNCNICDPGYESRENIQTISQSAAKAGFTSITCSPLTSPVIDNKTMVMYIKDKAKDLSAVNIFPYGSMSKEGQGKEMAEIGEMYSAGIVGVSDGNVSICNANLMRNILIYSSMFDLPVITFCENPELAACGVMNYGTVSTVAGLIGKPREAEETYIARNLILAKHNKGRLHITHVSTQESVEIIRYAKKMGVNVTCDTCPHYFTLSENKVDGYNTFAKVNPPLRTVTDIAAIIEGLRDGTIDAISTGHSPTFVENKWSEFDKADFGISSMETAFALCYTTLVKTGVLTIWQLAEKLSKSPAKILKLNTRGEISPGMDADICIIDDKKEYRINAKSFESKAKFSPHDTDVVTGMVTATFVSGNLVYSLA